MRRRDFILGAGAGAALATGLGWLGQRWRSAKGPPNIILLLADDMRWDAMGWMGNPYIRTPVLDALAKRSACFLNHFVTTSICCTSRASILTGQYARRHGIWDFETPLKRAAMEQSFPFLLKQSGYHTGFIGKWGVGDRRIELARFMYDYYDAFPGHGDYFPHGPQGEHLTDLQGKSAAAFLAQSPPGQPFCLQISFKAPHTPNLPAPRFQTHYADIAVPHAATDNEAGRAAVPPSIAASRSRSRWQDMTGTDEKYQEFIKSYWRLIEGIDETVGVLLAEMERRGQAENTCILFTSDNGHMIGEHGLWGKWIMYEESMRVPLMIALPPGLRSGPAHRRIDAMTLNIDLASTLLSLAGLPRPQRMQGEDLISLIHQPNRRWRQEMFYEHFYNSPPWPIVSCEGVRTPEWKYTLYDQKDAVLFHLLKDPREERNLAGNGEYAGMEILLRQRMEQYRREVV